MPLANTSSKLAKLPTRIVERLFATLLWGVSLVIPRSTRIWAFGSWYGKRFADNPKHFFLYCNAMASQHVQAVWLSRNRKVIQRVRRLGLRAHHRLSPRGLWYSLRAGVYLIDCRVMDISPIASSGAIVVNLWHGVPLKRIEGDIEQPDHPCVQARRGPLPVRIANRLLRPQLTERYDFILATSAATAVRFGSAFGVGPERIITAGYPRTDPLLSDTDASRYLLQEERDLIAEFQLHAREARRVLLYMPTFRDWNNIANRAIPIDWTSLDSTLEAHGGVLYCKLHPADEASLPSFESFRQIRTIDANVDPYPILKYTDALISDYSSIFLDYLMLDRPVIFYPYDLEEYQSLSRTLYEPYDETAPGPRAHTAEEFEQLVADLLHDYPGVERRWREDRARVRGWSHEFVDDRSSERLVAALLERLAA